MRHEIVEPPQLKAPPEEAAVMKSFPTAFRPVRRNARPLVVLLVFSAMLPVPLGAQDCDCSCESYQQLRQVAEQYQQNRDAGNARSVPPELMQMSMCAGQCAMQWAQCENPDMDMGAMQRAQERAMERARQGGAYTGDAASDGEPAMQERAIGETEKNMRADAGLPKERLTNDYLEGTWCSVYGGQEVTQWRFHADGRYEIGVAAGRGWQMHNSGDSIGEYHERFDKLVEFEPDAFTTEHRGGRKNVFTRGPCR
jgi:hypothetical protein